MVYGSEVRISALGLRVSGSGFGDQSSRFWVSGFGFRIWGSEFRVSGFGFSVSDLGLRVPGFRFRVSNLVLLIPGFGFRVSGETAPRELGGIPVGRGSQNFKPKRLIAKPNPSTCGGRRRVHC